MSPEEVQALLVKVVDHVATPAEREALMQQAVRDDPLRLELERHMALKAITDGWVARLEHDLRQDELRTQSPTRHINTLGLVLLCSGLAVFTGGDLWRALTSPDVPAWIQVGVALTVTGITVLLANLVYIRHQLSHSDPYKDVIR